MVLAVQAFEHLTSRILLHLCGEGANDIKTIVVSRGVG
jgi:hypothetical protein